MRRKPHTHRQKTRRIALVAAACLPTFAHAGDWAYSATLYGWMAGLDTSIETAQGTLETELSFADVLEKLDAAFFGAFEAQSEKLGFILDLNHTNLTASKDTPFGAAFRSATVETTLSIASGYATWRVSETAAAQVDIAGGFRAYDLDLDVTLNANTLPTRSFTDGDRWVDPLVGFRVQLPISDRWSASALADIGGFGIGNASEMSWQATATVEYSFNETWALRAGYSHMDIDKDLDGRDVTLTLSGPVLGISARF
ncbi:hypothetical protein [Meridianimarinicoccus aquatilis]|uniref:Outer membrane protein beta-barrel domain-containing protein n=1 Tax=Meridianimarinicoccus aquatilis TaxID=2552766 RepID=A0A4V3BBD1_9RHOB|nr:hypothetical protein [Fluviibacterium aquatile]TDL86329.1 hypothetical protein E2L05_13720 [Fluviibacterium aquatile]